MRTMRILLMLLLALALLGAAQAEAYFVADDHLGEALPDFTVTTIDGDTFTLSEALKEKNVVLVNLWATWCGPCNMEFPYMEAAYEQYADRVEIIALSVEEMDTNEKLREYVAANGLTFPVANGTQTAIGMDYTSIPVTIVVDRFGNIGYAGRGAHIAVSDFTRLFDFYLSEDYAETQVLTEIPEAMPTVDRPDPAELSAALNAEGGALTFENDPDEAVWPFVPAEAEGRDALVCSNVNEAGTAAAVLTRVTAAEGDALAFDFRTSTQAGLDLLSVAVDGAEVKAFGGDHDWTTWAVPLTAGEHEAAFRYEKDDMFDDGEDAVWLDNVRLVSGEEAAALLAALPVTPTGDANGLTLLSGGREIVLEGDVDQLAQYVPCDTVWIPDGEIAEIGITLAPDVDPERVIAMTDFDGLYHSMAECLGEEGYRVTSGIDSLATTGYSCSCVYLSDQESFSIGALLFADQENLNSFIEMLAEEGLSLSWREAAEADGAEVPEADDGAQSEEATYTARFSDQNGDPVPGCVINFCTDDSCQPVFSDESGVATFTGAPYPYHLQVIKVPEGYSFDTTREFTADPAGGEMAFEVTKE